MVEYKVPDNVRLGVKLAQKNEGVTITKVIENTNAERAGIRKGDLLLSMDGEKISRVEEVIEQLQSKNFDDSSSFRLRRSGAHLNVKVVFKK